MKKLIKGKVYMVWWVDTFGVLGWIEVEDMKAKCKANKAFIQTVGFYIGNFDGYDVFCDQFTENPTMINFANMTAIPQGVIKKLERLV